MHDNDELEFDDPDYKSKTQIKDEATALRNLGVEIAGLPLRILDTLNLDTELRAAIDDYRRITHKNALKRQASFVGKLMRNADVDEIKAKLNDIQESGHKLKRQSHLIIQWRDRLVDETDADALNEFLSEFPQCDRQQLRSLMRAAAKEKAANKSASGMRKLYTFVQALMAADAESDY